MPPRYTRPHRLALSLSHIPATARARHIPQISRNLSTLSPNSRNHSLSPRTASTLSLSSRPRCGKLSQTIYRFESKAARATHHHHHHPNNAYVTRSPLLLLYTTHKLRSHRPRSLGSFAAITSLIHRPSHARACIHTCDVCVPSVPHPQRQNSQF